MCRRETRLPLPRVSHAQLDAVFPIVGQELKQHGGAVREGVAHGCFAPLAKQAPAPGLRLQLSRARITDLHGCQESLGLRACRISGLIYRATSHAGAAGSPRGHATRTTSFTLDVSLSTRGQAQPMSILARWRCRHDVQKYTSCFQHPLQVRQNVPATPVECGGWRFTWQQAADRSARHRDTHYQAQIPGDTPTGGWVSKLKASFLIGSRHPPNLTACSHRCSSLCAVSVAGKRAKGGETARPARPGCRSSSASRERCRLLGSLLSASYCSSTIRQPSQPSGIFTYSSHNSMSV